MDRNRLKLSLMLLMITLPIGLATIVFHYSDSFRSFGNTSKGTLIQPVVDITALKLLDADGKPAYLGFEELTANVAPKDYKPRPWQLLYFGDKTCDDACQQRLFFLRQLHALLSKDASRMQRAYVLTGADEVDAATATYLKEQQIDMRVLHGDAATVTAVLKASAAADPLASHYIYVMDPVGNIMLYFTPDDDAKAILADLKKLLSSSGLG
ncbi:MAG TPA: hypothetical protein VMH83_02930 [Candidatus Acidoferrum sp.]|nr:hypothetical protein [Candidatus Acidoferrum sp.]